MQVYIGSRGKIDNGRGRRVKREYESEMEYEMKGGFLCRAVRQGGGHHLVPATSTTSRSLCSYLLPFRFIHTAHTTPSPPLLASGNRPSPNPTRHALYVRSPLLLSRFCMRGEQHSGRCSKGREEEREREKEEKRKFREACGEEEGGREEGEREILKRHKGRPHALKGNNSFRDRDRFYVV